MSPLLRRTKSIPVYTFYQQKLRKLIQELFFYQMEQLLDSALPNTTHQIDWVKLSTGISPCFRGHHTLGAKKK